MIIITQSLSAAPNKVSAAIRALSSITPQQADIVAQAVQASGRAWGIQTIDDYDGYLSILIQPSISDDEQKTFFIAGTAQRLKLFEAYHDDMTLLASFTDLGHLSARLLELISQQ